MRYKTSTSTTTSTDSSGNEIKKVTTTKTPYLTIGDIIGAGVTASKAVSKLSAMKNNPNVMKTAAGSLVGPLVALVKTMDAYKVVMNVIDKVTPAVQLVARGSGLFHSPGNIGDMLNIIWGKVQKVLVMLALSAVTTIKDIIWAIEIPFPSIDSSVSSIISKAVTSTGTTITTSTTKAINDTASIINGDSSVSIPSEVSALKEYSSGSNDEIQDIINSSDGTTVMPSGAKSSLAFNFIKDTGTKMTGKEYSRLIAGSSQNLGLFYSDDGGSTWEESSVTSGSWKSCGGKGGTYCAGSIGTYTASTDTSFIASKKYYSSDGGSIHTESPSSLGLYESSTDSSFSVVKSYYELGSGTSCTYASPESLGLYEDSSLSTPSADTEFMWKSGDEHYYYSNSGTAEIASPIVLGLLSQSQDSSFSASKKYYKIENSSYSSASPSSIGLLEETKPGTGIVYSTDYGSKWTATSKTSGSCNMLLEADAQEVSGIPATVIMASASDEGMWYCMLSAPSAWSKSNITSGSYHTMAEHDTMHSLYGTVSADAAIKENGISRVAELYSEPIIGYMLIKEADASKEE